MLQIFFLVLRKTLGEWIKGKFVVQVKVRHASGWWIGLFNEGWKKEVMDERIDEDRNEGGRQHRIAET